MRMKVLLGIGILLFLVKIEAVLVFSAGLFGRFQTDDTDAVALHSAEFLENDRADASGVVEVVASQGD